MCKKSTVSAVGNRAFWKMCRRLLLHLPAGYCCGPLCGPCPVAGDKRKPYSVLAGIAAGILCVIVCLDSLGSAGISPADILGMRGTMEKLPTWSADWLDFFDCIAEGILMPRRRRRRASCTGPWGDRPGGGPCRGYPGRGSPSGPTASKQT